MQRGASATSQIETMKKSTGRRNSGSQRWSREMRITDNERGDCIVVIPGEYPRYSDDDGNLIENPDDRPIMEMCPVKTHQLVIPAKRSDGSKYTRYRNEPCAAGWDKQNPKPCVYCYARAKMDMQSVGWPAVRYAFTIMHLDEYIKEHILDNDGRIKRDRDDKPMYRWVALSTIQGNEKENRAKAQAAAKAASLQEFGKEAITFGRQRYISLGSEHGSQLAVIIEGVTKTCMNCGKQLQIAGLKCMECGTVLIDSSDGLDPKEITKRWTSMEYCPHCHSPKEEMEYVYIHDPQVHTNCQQPMPSDPYQTVLRLCRRGKGVDSFISLIGTIPFKEFRLPESAPVKTIEELVADTKPFNFEEMFQPDDFTKASEIIGIDNPFQARGGGGRQNLGTRNPTRRADRVDREERPPVRQSGVDEDGLPPVPHDDEESVAYTDEE